MKDTSLTASRGLATLTPSITVVNTHGTKKYRAYTCYRTAAGDWRQITGSAPVPEVPEEENPAVHELAKSMAVTAMEKNMRRKLATGKTGTPRTHKLSEAIELFWKDKTKRNVRGNTRYTYEKQLAAVGKRLPDKSISAYSTAELQAVVDAIPEAAKVLKSIYYQAVREGWTTCLTFFERVGCGGASSGMSANGIGPVWLVLWKTGSAWRRSGRSP